MFIFRGEIIYCLQILNFGLITVLHFLLYFLKLSDMKVVFIFFFLFLHFLILPTLSSFIYSHGYDFFCNMFAPFIIKKFVFQNTSADLFLYKMFVNILDNFLLKEMRDDTFFLHYCLEQHIQSSLVCSLEATT